MGAIPHPSHQNPFISAYLPTCLLLKIPSLYTPILSYRISHVDIPRPKKKGGAQKHSSSRISLPDATVHIDVAVSEAADREHHAVRVEGRAGDRARARRREEGRVRLDGVDGRAGDVEEGEGVRVGAAVLD